MDRKKIVEMQLMEQQLKQMQGNIENIDNQMNELRSLLSNLEEVSKMKKGSEILFPVSNGIFAKAEIKEIKKLKVSVGSNVVVNKTVDSTKDMINDQIMELMNYRNENLLKFQGLIEQIQNLQVELEKDVKTK